MSTEGLKWEKVEKEADGDVNVFSAGRNEVYQNDCG